MEKRILVVGGAGYVGSHVCKALKKNGYLPVVYDNLSTGFRWAVKWGPLIEGDIRNQSELTETLIEIDPFAVIHLAAESNVRESFKMPAKYYENNVLGTLTLLQSMVEAGIDKIVFSSTAAIYGVANYVPLDEHHPKQPINPYGRTKWMIEMLLEDFFQAYQLQFVSLRYFNAAGADENREVGEAHEPETHLIPLVIRSARMQGVPFTLFGNRFPTPDGSAIRDFVHVADLADAHVKALKWMEYHPGRRLSANLGSGKGFSILNIIQEVQRCSGGNPLTYEISESSLQDPPILIADYSLARHELGWSPEHSSLKNIIQTAWAWHEQQLPLHNLVSSAKKNRPIAMQPQVSQIQMNLSEQIYS